MAEVDASIYSNIKTPNPLEMVGNLANLQNVQNQNKLFQQEYNSKLGLSQIYKEAIDPNTGQLDTQKLNQLMSNPQASGNVSLGLPQAYQNSQEAQQRNIGIDTSKLENAQAHLKALTTYLTPLANGNPSANDIAATLGHAITSGIATPQEAAGVWGSIPRDQTGNIDQTQLKPWVQQNLMRVMSAQDQLNAMSPAPSAFSTGGQTQFIRTPQIGAPSVAGVIDNTLPPTTSRQTMAVNHGAPTAIGPTSSTLQVPGQPSPPAAPQGQGSPLAGSMPGAAGNSAPASSPSPAASNVPVQTGLAPGEAEAATAQANASAQQGVALNQRADAVPQTKALLGNLDSELKDFTPGPGADWSKVAGAFSNRLLQQFGLPGIDPKSIASQEQFNKMAGMIAQTQFQSLGGTGTDKQLGSTEFTSPNSELSKMGNKGIIAMLKGNEDAIAAKNREWQDYAQAHGPQSYAQFSTQFNKEYDPRVFQSVYMSPQERSKVVSGMSKTEKDQFAKSYNQAVQKGWIPDPRQQNGGQ